MDGMKTGEFEQRARVMLSYRQLDALSSLYHREGYGEFKDGSRPGYADDFAELKFIPQLRGPRQSICHSVVVSFSKHDDDFNEWWYDNFLVTEEARTVTLARKHAVSLAADTENDVPTEAM